MKSLNIFLSLYLIFSMHQELLADSLPDYKRENNINEQIINFVFDSEIIKLNSELEREFNLVVDKESFSKYSVLLLHGRGLYPNEPKVMNPLKLFFQDIGYSVYSPQLPVLSKGETYNDYQKIFKYSSHRIQSSIEFISEKNIIIVAHSCGAHMLTSWLAEFSDKRIVGLVLLGAGAVDRNEKVIHEINYELLDVPIINIYGEFDHGSVKKNSMMFKKNYLSKNDYSANIEVEGANHDYEDTVNYVVEYLKEWLKPL